MRTRTAFSGALALVFLAPGMSYANSQVSQVAEPASEASTTSLKSTKVKDGTRKRNKTRTAGAAPVWVQSPFVQLERKGRVRIVGKVYVDPHVKKSAKGRKAAPRRDRLKLRVIIAKRKAITPKARREVAFLPRKRVLVRSTRTYVVKGRGVRKVSFTLSKKASRDFRRRSHAQRKRSIQVSIAHWKDTYHKSAKWSLKQISIGGLVKGKSSRKKTSLMVLAAKRNRLIERQKSKALRRFDRRNALGPQGRSSAQLQTGLTGYPTFNNVYIDNFTPFVQQVNYNPDVQCMWTGANTQTSQAHQATVNANSTVMFSYTGPSSDSKSTGITGATNVLNANGTEVTNNVVQDAVKAATFAAQQSASNMVGATTPEGAAIGLGVTVQEFIDAFLYDLFHTPKSTCTELSAYPQLMQLTTAVVGFGSSQSGTEAQDAQIPVPSGWNGSPKVPAGNQALSGTALSASDQASLQPLLGATTSATYYWNGGMPAFMVSNNARSGTNTGGSASFTDGLMQYVGPNPGTAQNMVPTFPYGPSTPLALQQFANQPGEMHIALSYLSGPLSEGGDYQGGLFITEGEPVVEFETSTGQPLQPGYVGSGTGDYGTLSCRIDEMDAALSLPFAGGDGAPLEFTMAELNEMGWDVNWQVAFHNGTALSPSGTTYGSGPLPNGGALPDGAKIVSTYVGGAGSASDPYVSNGSPSVVGDVWQGDESTNDIGVDTYIYPMPLYDLVSYNYPGGTTGQSVEVPGVPNYFGCSAWPVVSSSPSNSSPTVLSVNTPSSPYGTNWPVPAANVGWPASAFDTKQEEEAALLNAAPFYSAQTTVNNLNVSWQGLPATTWIPTNGVNSSIWGVDNANGNVMSGPYTSQMAFNVSRDPAFPQCSASGFDPITVGANRSQIGAYSDATGELVDLAAGNYSLKVAWASDVTSANPWQLIMLNASGDEVRWNGSAWITEPAGGWSGSEEPFSASGQLYGSYSDGVLYNSSAGWGTFLMFDSDNPLQQQIAAGSSAPAVTYTPASATNTCNSSGYAVYTGDADAPPVPLG